MGTRTLIVGILFFFTIGLAGWRWRNPRYQMVIRLSAGVLWLSYALLFSTIRIFYAIPALLWIAQGLQDLYVKQRQAHR